MYDSNPYGHSSFVCQHCGTHSTSEVEWMRRVLNYEGVPEDKPPKATPNIKYTAVACTRCGEVSLLRAERIDWASTPDEDMFMDDVTVYPAPPRNLSAAVPKSLRECFREARACYQAAAYTASAIMCRRALELLANERGVKEHNLATAIAKLKERGDIDQRLFDWCDSLRLAGNRAAHDVSLNMLQADAKDMNELSEAIIDYVYVFQARYEAFRQREIDRAEKSAGK